MLRSIAAVVAGVIAWIVVATVLNWGMRYGWPGYRSVEKAMTFTSAMMAARMAVSFVATLSAGATAAWIARGRPIWPAITGLVLLALFIPVHISIWSHFPVWYHLTFLPSLPILASAGGYLVFEARSPRRKLRVQP